MKTDISFLYFKVSLSAKSLSWRSVFIHMKNTTCCRNQNFGFRPSLKKRLRRTGKWSIFYACLASPDLQVSGGRVYFARFFLFGAGIPDCAKFTLSAPADPLVTIKCSGNEVKVASYIISPVSLCSYTFIYYSSFYRFLLICAMHVFFFLFNLFIVLLYETAKHFNCSYYIV